MASTEVIALVILKNKEIYHSVINKEITTYFTKNAIKEIIETFSKIILEKSNIGAFSIDMESEQIQNIELRKYILHCRKFDNDNGITFITSKNYKHRIAYNLILQLKDILDKTQINSLFYESNDVQKIDIIEKINKDLGELKIIMYKNIEAVLDRGEKIETLMMKSKALSENSKRFYVASKKMNRCCSIM